MMLKRLLKSSSIGLALLLTLFLGNIASAQDSINEKYGLPIVVYGEALSNAQKEEVRRLLKVDDPEMVREMMITANDIVYYIDGDPHSNMYSSAKITRGDSVDGLVIEQVTPENITEVTDEMYANALLTAGIENAVVEVASPVKVSGHSALVGIYKAYDEGDGTALNKERTEVANEELSLATELAKEEGLDQDKVSELLTEIKKEMAERNPASAEEIKQIIDEKLQGLEIQLSEEDRQLLIDLFEKMRNLNIDFDNVQSQLENISKDIQQRIEEAIGDKGFLQAVSDFFQKLIDGIKSLFS